MNEISGIIETYRIMKSASETPAVNTIEIDADMNAKPGQFVMVWIPGVDEIPISVSGKNTITVKNFGEASAALQSLKQGDYVGLRGPYGNGFNPEGYKKILVVGGGVGIPPLRYLVKSNPGKKFTCVLGAKNGKEIFYENDFSSAIICTDDGSMGEKAFTTQVADRELSKGDYDLICACGPEVMLKHLFDIAEKHNVPVQFSMERWMKCGFGICGHCSTDPDGWQVCRDGPVITSEQLRKNREFFRYKRDKAGVEVGI